MVGCHVQPEQMFNLIWGYNDIWDEVMGFTATATSGSKSSGVVPAGEIQVLQVATMYNQTRAGSTIAWVIVNPSAKWFELSSQTALAQYAPGVWSGTVVLAAGDYVLLSYAAVQVNDVLVGGVRGYKMKLTQ